ncbi:hypothetical protein [Limnochorda pilosa]|uniref:Zinc resistance-associated protein n=1 Tax=Limnochorda pilosa TaxID=1555112 RepID=A0A0K2SKC9_LIMPI|nr:hypothetical protein [Limnochorda pilosa]BAS27566.1 hypothetical protein LIP_1720 [Limnochorda pilosa]
MSRRLVAIGGALLLVLGLAIGAAQTLNAQQAETPQTQQSPAFPAPYAWDRWNSLNDEQKAELQNARNQILDAQLQLLEKQAELGLVDPRVVEYQKQRIEWLKQAPAGPGPGAAYGCPGYGPQGARGFGARGRSYGAGRGPGMGGWGMMGPAW